MPRTLGMFYEKYEQAYNRITKINTYILNPLCQKIWVFVCGLEAVRPMFQFKYVF